MTHSMFRVTQRANARAEYSELARWAAKHGQADLAEANRPGGYAEPETIEKHTDALTLALWRAGLTPPVGEWRTAKLVKEWASKPFVVCANCTIEATTLNERAALSIRDDENQWTVDGMLAELVEVYDRRKTRKCSECGERSDQYFLVRLGPPMRRDDDTPTIGQEG